MYYLFAYRGIKYSTFYLSEQNFSPHHTPPYHHRIVDGRM